MFEVRPDILEISKALGEETRFAIFSQIAGAENPLTVKDLVGIFGMHHSAIRIHLNRLEDAGLIVSQKRHTKGAVGRPQLAFLPNPESLSISLPPRNYQFLAQLSLELASRTGVDIEVARSFARDWGRQYMQEVDGGTNLPLDHGLRSICDVLRELGGATEWARENDTGSYLLTERNCPFREFPHDHDELICAMHQAFARGMLAEAVNDDDITWEHVASMRRDGAAACLSRVGRVHGLRLSRRRSAPGRRRSGSRCRRGLQEEVGQKATTSGRWHLRQRWDSTRACWVE